MSERALVSASKQEYLRPLTIAIIGTHAAGKSTIIEGIEQGKISDLGIDGGYTQYEDFGYGIVEADPNNQVVVVTVPEAARWYAELRRDLTILAENHNPDIQRLITGEAIFRTHEAQQLAPTVVEALVDAELVGVGKRKTWAAVLTDRTALDGMVYMKDRYGDGEPQIMKLYCGGLSEDGLLAGWHESFIDCVFASDHTEIPFVEDSDKARSSDLEFRDRVFRKINNLAIDTFGKRYLGMLRGDAARRKQTAAEFIGYIFSDQ